MHDVGRQRRSSRARSGSVVHPTVLTAVRRRADSAHEPDPQTCRIELEVRHGEATGCDRRTTVGAVSLGVRDGVQCSAVTSPGPLVARPSLEYCCAVGFSIR